LARNEATVPLTFIPGFDVPCTWFNVPVADEPPNTPTATAIATETMTPDVTPTTPSDADAQGTPEGTAESTPIATTSESSPDVDEPGALTNRVWTCPQGFFLDALTSDPRAECSAGMNGVTFVLEGATGQAEGTTGEAMPGAVLFSDLAAGAYTVTELPPEGTAGVFVLDCTGMSTSSVHPAPLATGSTLQLVIAGGDEVRCDWFNVSEPDPGLGWMVVTAFGCTTPSYVSDVECLVLSGGEEIELRQFNGQAWVAVQAGTTDVAGKVVFSDLEPGTYQLYHPALSACMVKSDAVSSAPAGHLAVNADAQTTVGVYTCGQPVGTPETPTKYPNTGILPGR
jgi:hypothetical protein